MKIPDLIVILVVAVTFAGCNSSPRVIEGEFLVGDDREAPVREPMPLESFHNDTTGEHRVEVLQFQHTAKYSYLQVTENQHSFWIIIPRREVAVGEKYYYRGGLLTRHFHNQELDQVFETVYLVSEVVPLDDSQTPSQETVNSNQSVEMGTVSLSDLYKDPYKYEGKNVKVRGTCIKVNPMIMNRNWVHIEDGSGENLNLTITTNEEISVGSVVAMGGTVALNKDFGSGYRYDIILEEAVLK